MENFKLLPLPTELEKKESQVQFDRLTKELNLKHTFTFDEAWEFMLEKRKENNLNYVPTVSVNKAVVFGKNNFRKNIMECEKKMQSYPCALVDRKDIDAVNPLKHTFADGVCVREIFNPKGELIITNIHKKEHPFFLLKGDMSILTENGPIRIKAPYYGITAVGTKRIIYTHEDCVFVTIHVTRERDIKKLEEEFFTKDFADIEGSEKNIIDVFLNKKEE